MELTREYVEQGLNEVCFGSAEQFPLRATAERYFSPGYTQLTDGVTADFEEFLAHIALLRARFAGGRITVSRLVQQGNTFADQHRAVVQKTDGTTLTSEVYLFGEVDESGRMVWVEEITRMVAGGTAEDADLARAR